MIKQKIKTPKREQGFTLLELLLVVGLTATLVMGFGRLSTLWANRELADLSGIHMQKITELAETYVRVNASAVPAAFNPGVNDITADVAGLLPGGLTMTNPLRRDVEVVLNITPAPNSQYEVMVYTTGDPIAYSRLISASRAAGSAGGLITGIAGLNNANQAQSAFGLWTVGDTLATFNVDFTADVDSEDGGQLVSYFSLSLEEAFGAYLYREDMTAVGRPDLNTMFVDLNMNGNNVRGAGRVETNNMDVYNTATVGQLDVQGETTFTGSVNISGTTTVGQQLSVNNDVTVSAGDVTVATGDINAVGANIETVNAAIVNAPAVSATSLDVSANTVLTSGLTISGATTVTIDGEFQADTINANTLEAQELITDQMTINNDVNVNGDVTVTGSAVMDILAVDDCVTIQPGPAPNLNEQYGPNC